jgi:hypothetical protein
MLLNDNQDFLTRAYQNARFEAMTNLQHHCTISLFMLIEVKTVFDSGVYVMCEALKTA